MFLDTRAIQTANIRCDSNTTKTSLERAIPAVSSASLPAIPLSSTKLSPKPADGGLTLSDPPVLRQESQGTGTVFKRIRSKLRVVKRKERVGTGCDADAAGGGADGDERCHAVPGSAGGSSSCSNDSEESKVKGQDKVKAVESSAKACAGVEALSCVEGEQCRGVLTLVTIPPSSESESESNSNSIPKSKSNSESNCNSESESKLESTSPTPPFKNLAQRIQTLQTALHSSCNPSQFFPAALSFSLAGSSSSSSSGDNRVVGDASDVGSETPPQPPPQREAMNESHSKVDPQSLESPKSPEAEPESVFRALCDAKFTNMNFLTTSSLSLPFLPCSGGEAEGSVGGAGESDRLRSVLDRWRRVVDRGRAGKDKQSESGSNSELDADSDGSDDSSSVVLSCAIELTDETEVEVARSEVVCVDSHDTDTDDIPLAVGSSREEGDDTKFKIWSIPMIRRMTADISDSGTGGGLNRSRSCSGDRVKKKKREIRVWYPSRSKVSVEATWWGYRIYLPPPVMQILSDKSLEAAKRAAMITAALTWLVSHVPVQVVPPQMKPLTVLLKEIVPLVGYVGGFIAWSWNTVKGFDKGDGVILSATWLLPIALIPGTWVYTEPRLSCESEIPLEDVGTMRRGGGSSPPPLPPPKDIPAGRS